MMRSSQSSQSSSSSSEPPDLLCTPPAKLARALSSSSSSQVAPGQSVKKRHPRLSQLRGPLSVSVAATPRSSVALRNIPPSPCLKKLGFGTGVKVFLYERSPSRSPWAIKKLNRFPRASASQSSDETGHEIADRLEHEAGILRRLKHPHIIGYRGYKRQADGTRILAVENGERALADIIEDAREAAEYDDDDDDSNDDDDGDKTRGGAAAPFPPERILFVVRCLAKALHYLHTEQHLLHGDLKSGNVLIKGHFADVKLCDFGVTMPLNEELRVPPDHKGSYVGTGPWSAMEAQGDDDDDNGGGVITHKTDVFALGCVIYEMLALEAPHVRKLSGDGDEDDEDYDEDENLEAYELALGTRPDLPDDVELDDSYDQVLSAFFACTEEDPDKRPSAEMILNSLAEGAKPL